MKYELSVHKSCGEEGAVDLRTEGDTAGGPVRLSKDEAHELGRRLLEASRLTEQ